MADKIKKLSEAIRIGATFREQSTDHGCGTDDQYLTSCALVAAVESVFNMTPMEFVAKAEILYHLQDRFNISPAIWRQIVERNDKRGQTREQIADWLEAQGL